MSKVPASAGAFSAPASQPAILLIQPPQGSNTQEVDCSVTRIGRMLQAMVTKEEDVKLWETKQTQTYEGKRLTMVDGRLTAVPIAQLMRDSLKAVRTYRSEHMAEIRHLIDYAVNVKAYEDVPCPDCRLSKDIDEFIAQLPDFEKPATPCETCSDLGTVRRKKTDKQTVEDVRVLRYWDRVLDDFSRCCKIRAHTSDADQAYLELEAANARLLKKFGNERQTSMEGPDAEQGVRLGIIDTAMKFDPLRRKHGKFACATFNTVAHNWCFRNSRARKAGDKRAGVYAQSIDAENSEGNSRAAMVTESVGALGVMSSSTPSGVCGDRCTVCGDRAEIDSETWQSTGYCKPCSVTAKTKKKKKKGPAPGSAFTPGGQSEAPFELQLDLREKVEALPDLQRQVMLYDLADIGTSAIAQKLDITRAKVRKLRQDAMASLRATMSGYAMVLHD